MEQILTVDPYKKNAYSDKVSFDLTHRSLNESPKAITGSHEDYNPEVSLKRTPSKDWELDVRALISTKKWLLNYGLKKNKLSLFQLLPVIGFKLSDDFDRSIKRPVSSRYAEGLFEQIFRPDGKTYNITCSRDKLKQIGSRLQQALHLYKRRLEWLTTESRRLFGVIEEKAVTIVLDIRNMSPQQFDLYRMALERVLYEQVTQVSKFNLIRAADDMKLYQEECVPVTHDTIEGAIKWLWSLDRLSSVSNTSCVESVLRAIEDRHNEAVYLYTEGSSVDSSRELLKEKVCALQKKPSLHIVSYNCDSSDTVRFLREFASAVGGKFHVYAVVMEMDTYEGLPVDQRSNKANIVLKRRMYGGIPAGAGIREDVILLFQEMEEARSSLIQVQKLIGAAPDPDVSYESSLAPVPDPEKMNEQYMSSRHWLEKYGLAARKLELFDVLGGVAFKHKDGVVELKHHPGDEYQTDAVAVRKLVNAKYCDRFPVVRWRDGRVVHVQVTPELHRNYEQRMLVALRAIQQRIDWLNQGSRALFGTVIEDQIYILIDTSESMVPSIQYVKDKLFLLMQEQLRHKMKFNLVAFNSKAQVWQNRLVDVGETSLEGAWKWIQGLSCWGSTNTYAALQHALSDPGTQAIYLLTDGRPDQPPKSIIAQVQMQHSIPVHTIAFNCNDTDANQFLFDLAQATGGRYHYFSDKGFDPEGQPKSWESEDIRILKDTLRKGLEDLDRVAELRDECAKLSWKSDIEEMKKCSKNHPMPKTDRPSAVPSMDPKELYRSPPSPPPPRPSSAPPDASLYQPAPPPKMATSLETRSMSTITSRSRSLRPSSAKTPVKKPLAAGHTRTSLLRTLNSSGSFSADEWLLPETRQLFEKQAVRQKKLAQVEARKDRSSKAKRRFAKIQNMSSKQWLSKHGLVAKKLTLLDALAPTFIPHKSKYVPILDKHVLSKVFDEVLPIAHVSNKSRKPIKLINPNAANLQEYERKLERALDQYSRRLDILVWEGIPKEILQEEFGEDSDPVQFLNNRSWFMKALGEAGWPVKEQDILALEEEIDRGQRFLQQSKDLRRAANPSYHEADEDDLTVYDDKASVESGLDLSARSKDKQRSKESLLSARSQESLTSTSSKGSKASSRSSASSKQQSMRSMEASDAKKRGRLRQKAVKKPLGGGGGRRPDRGEPPADTRDPQTPRSDRNMKGLSVIACYKADGLYYPGHLTRTAESSYGVVEFNFKKCKKIRTKLIIPIGGAVPRPELAEGDFVLVRVYNSHRDLECYVPGIVQVIPEHQHHHAKFYSVLMYNGQVATTMRKSLVKIGHERFEMAVQYICEIQDRTYNEERSQRDSQRSQSDEQHTEEEEGPSTSRSQPRKSRKTKSSSRSRSRSSSRSRSRSRSYSSSRSRSGSRSGSDRRSRKKRKSSQSADSGSRSSSRSTSRSRSSSRSPDASTRRSKSGSKSRSRSRSRSSSSSESDSALPRSAQREGSPAEPPPERPQNPVPPTPLSRQEFQYGQDSPMPRVRRDTYGTSGTSDRRGTGDEEKDVMIGELHYQLEKQKRKQLRQERRLVRQARKLNKITRKLKEQNLNQDSVLHSERSHRTGRSSDEEDRHVWRGSPQPRKESPDGVSYNDSPDLTGLRRSLPGLQLDGEVLARWSDDGWYYRGRIVEECGSGRYAVRDRTGHQEVISREDILTEEQQASDIIQPGDCVVALHPSYIFSYAPAKVLDSTTSQSFNVEFFDGTVSRLPQNETYKISRQKYELDGNYIVKCEKQINGKSVVCREDDTGSYRIATVGSRVGVGQRYYIKWQDGLIQEQTANHIFDRSSLEMERDTWEHVLAPADQRAGIYLPGQVVSDRPLQIQLCDGTRLSGVSLDQCVWLSKEYYRNAVDYFYFKHRQPGTNLNTA